MQEELLLGQRGPFAIAITTSSKLWGSTADVTQSSFRIDGLGGVKDLGASRKILLKLRSQPTFYRHYALPTTGKLLSVNYSLHICAYNYGSKTKTK